MTLLVVLEHDRGEMVEAAREALTAGRALADRLDETVQAVAIGAGAESVVAEAGIYGAEIVHLVSHELLTDYGPDAWAESLLHLSTHLDAEVVMTTGTDRGNEVMAQLAARTDEPFVANCLSVDAVDESWAITRMQWGGSLLEEVDLDAECKLMSFADHAVVAKPLDEGVTPEVVVFEPDLDEAVTVTMIRDRELLTQGITLSTAAVVVSGGRGVGSADGFAPLEELAELLGGVVGCSRAVTNNGWRPHTDQVGQTGTRIAPEIYIATGISGAIQHWVGAMASKKILAINTDPEANMVTKADYAVIADLHDVVPAICAEIRRRRGEG